MLSKERIEELKRQIEKVQAELTSSCVRERVFADCLAETEESSRDCVYVLTELRKELAEAEL